ncbi:hypothetical protein CR513_09996, partial [Mucuna pruriens]
MYRSTSHTRNPASRRVDQLRTSRDKSMGRSSQLKVRKRGFTHPMDRNSKVINRIEAEEQHRQAEEKPLKAMRMAE